MNVNHMRRTIYWSSKPGCGYGRPTHLYSLLLNLSAPVLHVRRLRSADEAPIAVLDNYLLDPEGVTEEALEEQGLYELLRARGTTLRVARQVVGARAATTEESRRLDVPPGSPVLTLHRTAYNDSGEVVELGRHSYRPDRYSVEFTVVNK